jgi:hypothetical protein
MGNAAVDDRLKHPAHPLPRHAETIRPQLLDEYHAPARLSRLFLPAAWSGFFAISQECKPLARSTIENAKTFWDFY